MAISPTLFADLSQVIAERLSVGHYEVKLAETESEIRAAQQLRYEVLFKESGGEIAASMRRQQREEDEWDRVAYHVVVVEKKTSEVKGTIRLVSRVSLQSGQGFYTEHAFSMNALLESYPKALELSRACVSPNARGGAVLMLLWKFTMNFIQQNQYDVLLGCASFKGQNINDHAPILTYLYEHHLAPETLMPHVKPEVTSHSLRGLSAPAPEHPNKSVPALLKGYLKIGARISDHAVSDPVFNTTFVMIYVVADAMFESGHSLVDRSTKSQ